MNNNVSYVITTREPESKKLHAVGTLKEPPTREYAKNFQPGKYFVFRIEKGRKGLESWGRIYVRPDKTIEITGKKPEPKLEMEQPKRENSVKKTETSINTEIKPMPIEKVPQTEKNVETPEEHARIEKEMADTLIVDKEERLADEEEGEQDWLKQLSIFVLGIAIAIGGSIGLRLVLDCKVNKH